MTRNNLFVILVFGQLIFLFLVSQYPLDLLGQIFTLVFVAILDWWFYQIGKDAGKEEKSLQYMKLIVKQDEIAKRVKEEKVN